MSHEESTIVSFRFPVEKSSSHWSYLYQFITDLTLKNNRGMVYIS